MFVRTFAGAVAGIDAVAVTVEVNIAGGGLGMYLVGLPDNAVKESEQRIRAAFENSGERMSGKKVVVSLAPADLRKEGAGFDLPIAVGILAAMGAHRRRGGRRDDVRRRTVARRLAQTRAGRASRCGPGAFGGAAAGGAAGGKRGGGRGCRRHRGDRRHDACARSSDT